MSPEAILGDPLDNVMEDWSLERRLAHLERSMSVRDAVLIERLTTITQKVDSLSAKQDKPINWVPIVSAAVAILTLAGGILYQAYISPVAYRIERAERNIERLGELHDAITMPTYKKSN